MKKILFFFAAATLALTTGCDGDVIVDYGCELIFEVENKTEFDIVFMLYEKEEAVIKSGKKEVIRSDFGLCGKNTIITDQFVPGELMFGSVCKLLLDGEPLPDAIWKRDYWIFSAKEYYDASYTLTVTNELIESLE